MTSKNNWIYEKIEEKQKTKFANKECETTDEDQQHKAKEKIESQKMLQLEAKHEDLPCHRLPPAVF